jgi:hypothetical protein
MNANYVVPIVSVSVSAIVSVLVVFLGRRSETVKLQQSLKTTAYVDFIRGVAGLAILQRHTIQDQELQREGWRLKMLVADAKARIAIYGGSTVVRSMAKFLRGGAVLDTPERAKSFVGICQSFRNDSSPKPGKVPDPDVHFLLFDFELSDYLGE